MPNRISFICALLSLLLLLRPLEAAQLNTDKINFGEWPIDMGPIGPSYVWVLNYDGPSFEVTPDDITIEGPGQAAFRMMDHSTTTSIVYRFSLSIPILFDPSEVGETSATLTISPAGKVPLSVILTGTGATELTLKPYDGYGPGFSTIGDGGTYVNFAAAAADMAARQLTGGNWTFLITSDLVEPGEVVLPVSSAANTTLFRPMPGTEDILIDFTSPTAFKLEIRNRSSVVFDGSSVVGGTTRDMHFRNALSPESRFNIQIYGNSDFGVVRNCIIENRNNSTSSNSIFSNFQILAYSVGIARYVPEHNLIENCEITNVLTPFGQAMTVYTSDTPQTYIPLVTDDLSVCNNNIRTSGRGFSFFSISGARIVGNTIEIENSSSLLAAAVLYTPLFYSPTHNTRLEFIGNNVMHIRSNSTNTAGSVVGLLLDAPGDNHVYNIVNNTFGSIQLTGSGSAAGVRGIHISRANFNAKVNILHNSINIEPSGAPYSGINSSNSFGIGITHAGFNGTVDIRNNIIHVGQSGGAGLYLTAGNQPEYHSDYNNLYANSGMIGVYSGAEYSSLQDWFTASGLDENSTSFDIVTPANSFSGWIDSTAPDADLHFASTPDPRLIAPRILAVGTDIDGDQRGDNLVIKGADEIEFDATRLLTIGAILGLLPSDQSMDANQDGAIDAADLN